MTQTAFPPTLDLTTHRLRLVAGMLLMGGAGQGAGMALKLGDAGWYLPYVITGVLLAMAIAYAIHYRDAFLGRLLVLGVLIGFGELFADAWAVSGVSILVYNPNGPFIWDSPAYMPFGWAVDVVELGAIGHWAKTRWNLTIATVITTCVGLATLPVAETIAHFAGFWHYTNCKLIGGVTPVFIVITEAMIAATMPLLSHLADRWRWKGLIPLAIAESAWMYAISPIVFSLVERL